MRRHAKAMSAALGLSILIGALFASSALAVEIHSFSSAFGSAGSGPGQFSANRAIAIDQSDGSVYVADAGNFRVQKFNAAGNFVLAFGKDVNQTTSGDICTAASGNTCGAGTQGSGGSGFDTNNGFSNPRFIAVDPTNGDVYVADTGTNVVDKFSSAGAFLSANDGSGSGTAFGPLAGIAVDASRNLWAYDGGAQMRQFDSAGAFLTQWNSGYGVSSIGIAVDSATNLYVARGTPYIEKFTSTGSDLGEANESAEAISFTIDPAGDDLYVGGSSSQVKRYAGGCSTPCTAVESFGSGDIANPAGVAVRGADGKAYVSDSGKSAVEVFSLTVLPGLTIESATGVTGTKATLHGTVNPDNLAVSDCKFEYGTTKAYGSTKPCEGAIPTDGNDHPVSAALTGIKANTTYHFRIAATNANGTNKSGDETFTTNQPSITGEATEVKGTKATLNGTVFPEGEAVSECFFEYGAGFGYGKTAPCVGAIPTDEGEHAVSAALTHLTPSAPVHFRLVINRGSGAIPGVDKSFTTEATVLTGAASAISPPTASVEGTLNPEGIPYTACSFEYGRTTAFAIFNENTTNSPYEGSFPCTESPASIGTGTGPVPVHAVLSGLTFGVPYHYRLVATNADGTSRGADQSFITVGAAIEAARVVSVAMDEATLQATINPKGTETTYRIEYGTDTSYGTSTAETPIGAENVGQTVTETLSGLAPATTYHWRVVATNSVGVSEGQDRTFTTYALPVAPDTSCPNQVFRTGPGAVLPDCRAYERATPADKHGANSLGGFNFNQASSAGNRITFANPAGLPTTGGSSTQVVYLASRSAGGWSSNGLLPLTKPGERAEMLGWDEEIATAASSPYSGGIYLGDTATGTFPLGAPTSSYPFPHLAGFAADTAHLTFESFSNLAPGAVAGRPNLYDLDGGEVTSVARIPVAPAMSCDDAGTPACVPAPEGSFAGSYDTTNSRTAEGGASLNYYTQRTISTDGSRIFFTAAGSGQLYLREGGTATTQVSASQATTPDPNGPKPAAFMAATPDGAKVFFSSCEKLTDDSTAVSTAAEGCIGSGQGQDLYSYDTASGDLTDLSVDPNVGDPQRAGVVGVLGASGDGSYVYFVANGVLAAGASPGSCAMGGPGGQQGKCNLYLSHGGAVTFIAPVEASTDDFKGWIPRFDSGLSKSKESRVAANGVLLFGSTQSLTGYDNTVTNDSVCAVGRCLEFYRYSPTEDELNCVSCAPTEAVPTGPARLVSGQSTIEGKPQTGLLTRNLSPDGNRAFFDSPDPLVAADVNGVVDPYEWEAEGTGSCHSAVVNGGCLYLLSGGGSPDPSYLGDVSASGNDAFIFTVQPLVPADEDQLYDVYDARVGGGLASQHPDASPSCLGEACRGSASSAPNESSPGSASFSGPGNQAKKPVKRCKKQSQKKCKKSKKQKKKSQSKQSRGAHNNRGGSK